MEFLGSWPLTASARNVKTKLSHGDKLDIELKRRSLHNLMEIELNDIFLMIYHFATKFDGYMIHDI